MEATVFSFALLTTELNSFNKKEYKDQLVQYNLNTNFKISKFRFTGYIPKTNSEYEQLIKDFLSSNTTMKDIEISGMITLPIQYDIELLKLQVTNMNFFDKLTNSGIFILTISFVLYNLYHLNIKRNSNLWW